MIFHSGSKYGYHFIIKEVATQFEGEINCLGENIEKCKTFLVHIRKEVKKTYKNAEGIRKT